MPITQRISQIFFTILYNSYLYGFFVGNIYQGKFKFIPCPAFNCHSCPAALFVCPIGAIQLFASYGKYYISFYILGFLGIIGAIGGSIVCGWACPFGFLQDLMNKIPSPKMDIPRKAENIKYLILFVMVFFIAYYTKEPWFCKLICPAGTLEAGIPLMLLNKDLRQLIDVLFFIKLIILIGFLIWMVFCKRPFCRTVCPLGAIYGLFNKVSLFTMNFNKSNCMMDLQCEKVCPVSHRIYKEDENANRCIRCLRCKTCPESAIKFTLKK
jgi:polyferredoxin